MAARTGVEGSCGTARRGSEDEGKGREADGARREPARGTGNPGRATTLPGRQLPRAPREARGPAIEAYFVKAAWKLCVTPSPSSTRTTLHDRAYDAGVFQLNW